MQSRLKYFFLFYICCVPLLFFCKDAHRDFAPKDFYLIDSLDLGELVGADKALIDSCLRLHHSSEEDTSKINALSFICENLKHNSWGRYQYYTLNRLDDLLSSDITNLEKRKLRNNLAQAYNNIGLYEYELGNVYRALQFYKKVCQVCDHKTKEKLIVDFTMNFSRYLFDTGKIESSIDYHNKLLNLCYLLKDSSSLIDVHNSLGMIFYNLKENHLARKNFVKSFDISKKINSSPGIARGLLGISSLDVINNDFDEAKEKAKAALKVYQQINHNDGMSRSFFNLGDIYEAQKQHSKALEYYKMAVATSKTSTNLYVVPRGLGSISLCYFKMKRMNDALSYSLSSLDLAKELGFPIEVRNAAFLLSKIYESKGEQIKSLEMLRLYVQMKDSLTNKRIREVLTKQKNKYELQLRDNKINLLEKETELRVTRLKLSIVAYTLLTLIMVVVGLWWFRKKKRNLEKELLKLRELMNRQGFSKSKKRLESIPVAIGKRIVLIDTNEITFFNTENKHLLLNNRYGKSYVIDYTITDLEDKLPDNFVRVHRSFIINKKEIAEIKKTYKGKVIFTMGDTEDSKVPSSQSYSKQVKSLINELG